MYLINQRFYPNKTGGRYKCKVFHVSRNGEVGEVTRQVADRYSLLYDMKSQCIIIRHGSGTGVMVITQQLEKHEVDPMNHDSKIRTRDISIF